MAVPPNIIDAAAINHSLDIEMVRNFTGEADRLMEILGIFTPETITAGTSLYQLKVTGSLNNSKTTPSDLSAETGTVTLGSSSGTSYVEGDEVALSKYSVSKESVGSISIEPYRKRTTAQAILKSGYDVAVMRTDRKMMSNTRGGIISKFFSFLGNGTGTATGTTLQAALANADAALANKMEDNGDTPGGIVHFVSRLDAAEYLGKQPITTQTAFGLTYLDNFLGLERVFLTSKVAKGSFYATDIDNIHIYGLDFAELSRAGLSYESDESGLIGVHHAPEHNCVSCETHVLTGMLLFPEIKDYIYKGTIAPAA